MPGWQAKMPPARGWSGAMATVPPLPMEVTKSGVEVRAAETGHTGFLYGNGKHTLQLAVGVKARDLPAIDQG